MASILFKYLKRWEIFQIKQWERLIKHKTDSCVIRHCVSQFRNIYYTAVPNTQFALQIGFENSWYLDQFKTLFGACWTSNWQNYCKFVLCDASYQMRESDWIYVKFYVGLSLFTFSCNITHSYTWNELNSSLYLWIFCLQITGKLYYSSNIPQTSQVWSCKASSNWQQKYIKNKSATHVIW